MNPVISRARASARLGSRVTDLPRRSGGRGSFVHDIYVDGARIGEVTAQEAAVLRTFVRSLASPPLPLEVRDVSLVDKATHGYAIVYKTGT